jgi:hypothetical protein
VTHQAHCDYKLKRVVIFSLQIWKLRRYPCSNERVRRRNPEYGTRIQDIGLSRGERQHLRHQGVGTRSTGKAVEK